MKSYISRIELNNGDNIDINANDIVVFVGPNNTGKSRALKDLHSLCQRGNNHYHARDEIVIKELELLTEDLFELGTDAINTGWGAPQPNGINIQGNIYNETDLEKEISAKGFGRLCDIFVFSNEAGARHYANSASTEMFLGNAKTEPIQFLSENKELRDRASKGFRKAYGYDLLPHRLAGHSIPLCMGSERELDASGEGKLGNDAMDAYKAFFDRLPKIQDQSDGIQSFASTLVNLTLKHKQIFMLDEPETFLHPPQIHVMGQIISEYLIDRQAFIATHSQDLVKGLLEVNPERVKIIRITREGNENYFKLLDNQNVVKLWKDPLLKHSDILNGLFHKSVVICESDADCKFYSVLLTDCKSREGKYLQAQFIPSNGKNRIHKIAVTLRELDIYCVCIVDIDLLFEQGDLEKIIDAFGGDFQRIQEEYNGLIGSIATDSTPICRFDFAKHINELLNGSNEEYLSTEEITRINKLIKQSGKWTNIKHMGEEAILSCEGKEFFNNIDDYLQSIGIYIVRCGELESFVKTIHGHGPTWVAEVLEKYEDYSSSVYDLAIDFISKIKI